MSKITRKRVAYCPEYAKLFDSVEVAVFLSQFEYWEGKQASSDGWIYKGQDDIYDETGLKIKQQAKVRDILRENKVLFEKRKIVLSSKKPKNLIHYQFDWGHLEALLESNDTIKRYKNQLENIKKQDEKKNDIQKQFSNLDNYECAPDGFDEWWKIYDKLEGEEKCKVFWLTISEEEHAQILIHTKELIKVREKQFRAKPFVYLSEKQYLDEIISYSNNKKNEIKITKNNDDYNNGKFGGIKKKTVSNSI